jgi:hypothetical protein
LKEIFLILKKPNYFSKLQKMIRNWIVEAKEEETGLVPQCVLHFGITQEMVFTECLPVAISLLAEWKICLPERSIIIIQR